MRETVNRRATTHIVLLQVMPFNKAFSRIVANCGRSFSTVPSSVQRISFDKRNAQLKKMIMSPQLEFIMEAHSALSAKIVEETGFKVSLCLRNK